MNRTRSTPISRKATAAIKEQRRQAELAIAVQAVTFEAKGYRWEPCECCLSVEAIGAVHACEECLAHQRRGVAICPQVPFTLWLRSHTALRSAEREARAALTARSPLALPGRLAVAVDAHGALEVVPR